MARLASLFRWTRLSQKACSRPASGPEKSAQAQAPLPQLESVKEQIKQQDEQTPARDIASSSRTLPSPSSPDQDAEPPKKAPSAPNMEDDPGVSMKELTKQESRLSQKSQKSQKSHKSHKSQKRTAVENPQPSPLVEVPVPEDVGTPTGVTKLSGRSTNNASISNSTHDTDLISKQGGEQKKGLMDAMRSPEAPLPAPESKPHAAAETSQVRPEKRKSIMRFLSKRQTPTRSATYPIAKPTYRAPTSPSSISPISPTIMETSEKELENIRDIKIGGRKWQDNDNDSLYCY